MIACGPYTVNSELSFEPLKDLLPVINKEQPHALILCGPFISQNNEQIQSGDIRFNDPEGNPVFLTYDELMNSMLDYIYDSLEPRHRDKLEIVFVPSHQEITHIYPVPQPPMPKEQFA